MNINIYKIISLILFFLIVIPNGKFNVFNGVWVLFSVFNIFNKEIMFGTNLAFTLIVLFGLILVFFKSKYVNTIGYFFTIIWLAPKISVYNLKKEMFFSITFLFYLISVFLFFYLQFKRNNASKHR